MSDIDYDHRINQHSLEGAQILLQTVFGKCIPESLLDVGCGPGIYLRAAQELGVRSVRGIDGIDLPADEFAVSKAIFTQVDLEQPWDLGEKFDIVLCLEVAEHLTPEAAEPLIKALTRHSDTVVFSAAAPGQNGQHHIHCRWPAYWQSLFNARGFVCDDAIRWKIWDNTAIELWYRQNVIVARRSEAEAGNEPRIIPILYPLGMDELLELTRQRARLEFEEQIKAGSQTLAWYLNLLISSVSKKFGRKFRFRPNPMP